MHASLLQKRAATAGTSLSPADTQSRMPGRSGRGKSGGGGGGGGEGKLQSIPELAALEAELQAKAGLPEGGARLAILTACKQAVVERGGQPSCAAYTSALLGSLANGGDEDLTQNVMFLLGHILLNLQESMHRAKFPVTILMTLLEQPPHGQTLYHLQQRQRAKNSKDNNLPHDAAPLDRPRDCTQPYNPCIANAPDVLWFSEA